MSLELSGLTTEKRNKNSKRLDKMSTIEILETINAEDKKVAFAVEKVLPQISLAIDQVYEAFVKGGRLFYVGAGTSGRLGVLDASECPPTFMSSPEMIQTIMAGGDEAFYNAVENSEDDEDQGRKDLEAKKLTGRDVVIGITASGRTPYPIGALKYARETGAFTVALACNENAVISRHADCQIEVVVGPEVLTGSTRMKAGTAHKMVLNMISTAAMVKLGKVYENLMVDVHASNYKLLERAKRIIMEITSASYQEAEKALKDANGEVKPAIVMAETGVSLDRAKEAIREGNGYVRQAIDLASRKEG
ncbi:N-acetylmuramic acid 6-phosphate etherase [Sediminibacillus massiliensis]|uniref:N-acetylmuramic acid 6-phosphate etherase n=1 Tax=Sediminibacillus massiliensis TaxID=1926277 RepID=UPI000988859B|nr:N-acetylmuramic acid 6-phosphate etherase [Sediminibacillus massiliensis]